MLVESATDYQTSRVAFVWRSGSKIMLDGVGVGGIFIVTSNLAAGGEGRSLCSLLS